MQKITSQELPTAIIGAGPVGLAAAAHLVKRNMPFLIFEAGEQIAANIQTWEHVKVFSPWKYNLDNAAKELLEANAWQSPDEEKLPTGRELLQNYLHPLSKLPSIAPNIRLGHKVIAINRKNLDKLKTQNREQQPFVVQTLYKGRHQRFEVRAVIDASGTWQSQNPAGSGGVFAVGEIENKAKIFYGIPNVLEEEKSSYSNKNILVVGSGHSAAQVLFNLSSLSREYPNTNIHWVVRKSNVEAVFGGKDKDQLPARGAIGKRLEKLIQRKTLHLHTGFHLHQIESQNGQLTIEGLQNEATKLIEGIDEIIVCTGSRPDFSFLRELRVDIHPAVESVTALADLIDPNVHSCGTVPAHGAVELQQPEKDLYVVGMKSYGRAPTFLMATGYEQVRSVVAALDEDWKAAKEVNLVLPETGVCSAPEPILELNVINNACCSGSTLKKKKSQGCC
ncbi:MAG: NAD(P)-binding domain-containing protein [Chitinophagales bacterium]